MILIDFYFVAAMTFPEGDEWNILISNFLSVSHFIVQLVGPDYSVGYFYSYRYDLIIFRLQDGMGVCILI